jgi:hypothetical protein
MGPSWINPVTFKLAQASEEPHVFEAALNADD